MAPWAETPLFDLVQAEQAKDQGASRALDSDRVWPWRDHARSALTDLAATGDDFTSDDLVARVGLPDSGGRNNAVGALFISAAKQGLIRKTGTYIKARRTASHARMLAVWTGDPGRDFP